MDQFIAVLLALAVGALLQHIFGSEYRDRFDK
jgi:hypothetical protein